METIHKKLAKSLTVKKKVEIKFEHVAATFTYDDHYGQDERIEMQLNSEQRVQKLVVIDSNREEEC